MPGASAGFWLDLGLMAGSWFEPAKDSLLFRLLRAPLGRRLLCRDAPSECCWPRFGSKLELASVSGRLARRGNIEAELGASCGLTLAGCVGRDIGLVTYGGSVDLTNRGRWGRLAFIVLFDRVSSRFQDVVSQPEFASGPSASLAIKRCILSAPQHWNDISFVL